jgi:UDP-N-acetylmuramoyl-tripeptide--D-alanyl-D-alanine ligase
MQREARLWIVLGEMLELGDESVDAHRRVGRQAVEAGADAVVAVGSAAATQALLAGVEDERGTASGPISTAYAADATGAIEALADVAAGDVVLIKASRGIGLEVVADALVARFGSAGGDAA